MSFSQITTEPPANGGTADTNTVATSPPVATTKRSNLSWLSPLVGIASDLINYFVNKADYKEQFDMNNAEWERRFNLANQYNAQWADRLRLQGINPLSAIGQGVSGNSASIAGGPQMMSGPLSSLSNMLSSMATGVGIENTQVDTKNKEFDTLLKEQLLNYNSSIQPTLIDEAKARLNNTIQELENLKADEALSKEQANELIQRCKLEVAQVASLEIVGRLNESQITINGKKSEKLAQDLETGKFVQEYEKWHAEHEKQLSELAKTKGKITEEEWRQLYDSGVFGSIKDAELKNLEQTWNQMQASIDNLTAETNKLENLGVGLDINMPDKDKFALGILIYICTELI